MWHEHRMNAVKQRVDKQIMHKQREGRGQKPLIPKILGTAAVRREGENTARKGKNAEET